VEYGGEDIVEREKFTERLRRARKKANELNARSAFDVAAIAHDRLIHPVRPTNSRNEPRWEGSQAQVFLQHDIAARTHWNMKPQELYNSREVYHEFSLTIFREHIYQEEKRQKYINDKYNRNRSINL
jgi:hypothetical protein